MTSDTKAIKLITSEGRFLKSKGGRAEVIAMISF
jgi:hypothetical protein